MGGWEYLVIVWGGVVMGLVIRVLVLSEVFYFNNIMMFVNCLDFYVCLKLMRGERFYILYVESR